MRPDEHKKKKNAQYKKKHGITGKGQQTESKTDGSDRKKKENGPAASATQLAEKTQAPKQKVFGTNEKKQVVEGNSLEEENKQFRRRQIVSNWSRYEDSSDSEEDIPEQRGEDFNKLLAEAGGSAAQFRLKDEEDWDADKGQGVTSLVALDFEQLTDSLSCIPLQKRLGISEDLFLNEQKEEMERSAAENESKYKLKVNDSPHKYIDTDSKIAQWKACDTSEKKLPEENVSKELVTKTDSAQKTKPEIQSVKLSQHMVEVSDSDADKNPIDKIVVNNSNETKTKDIQSLEEDLDFILSLEESCGAKQNATSSSQEHASSAGSTKRIDSAGSKVVAPGDVQNTTCNGTKNLEDWLDDMLDD